MGIMQSRIVAQAILRACNNAEKQGRDDLDGAFLSSNDVGSMARKEIQIQLTEHRISKTL